jgi:hypothetical protein
MFLRLVFWRYEKLLFEMPKMYIIVQEFLKELFGLLLIDMYCQLDGKGIVRLQEHCNPGADATAGRYLCEYRNVNVHEFTGRCSVHEQLMKNADGSGMRWGNALMKAQQWPTTKARSRASTWIWAGRSKSLATLQCQFS